MALSRLQYDTIMKEYEQRRRSNQILLEERYEEVCKKIPKIKELDERMAHNSVQKGKALLLGSDPSILQELKRSNMEISMEKIELLVEHGYPKDYLEPMYQCASCKDTGYIGMEKCHCLKQAIIKMLYSQSGIMSRLDSENFDTFRLEYYSDQKTQDNRPSPRDNMRAIVQSCYSFTQNFPKVHDNFLFQGNAGVGKTFLSNCIAKALLDKECSVIYLTSFQLFDILEQHRFRKRQEESEEAAHLSIEVSYLFDCDLLIIDDLGTEMNNSFISSQLFLCINERLLKKKSTIISTNLSLSDLTAAYSERVVSRFAEHYHIYNMYGDDIRLLKAFHSY